MNIIVNVTMFVFYYGFLNKTNILKWNLQICLKGIPNTEKQCVSSIILKLKKL